MDDDVYPKKQPRSILKPPTESQRRVSVPLPPPSPPRRPSPPPSPPPPPPSPPPRRQLRGRPAKHQGNGAEDEEEAGNNADLFSQFDSFEEEGSVSVMPITDNMVREEAAEEDSGPAEEGDFVVLPSLDEGELDEEFEPISDIQKANVEEHNKMADELVAAAKEAAKGPQRVNQALKISLQNLVASIKIHNESNVSFFYFNIMII